MNTTVQDFVPLIRSKIKSGYQLAFREPGGVLDYGFLTPGSDQYADVLWDWDSWLSNIAIRQILLELNDPAASAEALSYERGCVLNFLNAGGMVGWIPILLGREKAVRPEDYLAVNMHKPCLAQHAAFLVKNGAGDAEWLREKFFFLQSFINCYRNHHRHHETGLYYWQNDAAIGVDNDPSTYYRPAKSSGSIFLNCLMYRELLALVYLCERLNLGEVGQQYQADADALLDAVQKHCWDEWLGFYYSVDLNLVPVLPMTRTALHGCQPRDWPCLIQRIGVWSGFLALWAGIATPQQAQRMVTEHYMDQRTFNAPFGVRTLSRMEKMYNLRGSGNPSSWLGPIWGISNYLTFKGLVRYGFEKEARELAEKTILLFGRDFQRFGALHEYYQPENGEPILNRGFQNWNYLVLNMAAWLEGMPFVEEF
jgi:putative isomerase